MKITAEGVETEPQASFLKNESCDSLQGFLLSRPIAESDVAALISTSG
jgi:EAL domain-containing protein (putative c-di-GMP-specific phosphodiesterase class I)